MPPKTQSDPSWIYRGFQDHASFCRESLMITNVYGELVPMVLGPAQVRLNQAIQQQRAERKPIRIIYLKARRVQISSGSAAQIFHQTPFHAGQESAVIAHDQETALKIFQFYETFARLYKPFAGMIQLPRMTNDSQGVLKWDNAAEIIISTARNVRFGRSRNLRRVQFDEFAFYEDPVKIRTAVMSAVPKDPDTMVIIPSTANGLGNAFHHMWLEANDPTGRSEWLAAFFAWWEHALNTLPLTIRGDQFQHSMDEEEREIKGKYNLTLEQLNWRRWVIANDFDGDVTQFRQEHPGNPEEAFVASSRLRFDQQSIGCMPVQRECVQGGIERHYIGIENRIVFLPREGGELRIFRKPIEGRSYVIGADTSEGIDASAGEGQADPDFSVAQVLDRETGEQVAVLRARLQPEAFGEYLDALGRYYNFAGIVPEVNAAGIGIVDALLRRGYPPQLLYHRRRQADQDPWERADLIGWKTTTVTRPQLLSKLDRALRELAIAVHDPVTIQELMTFTIGPTGKAAASRGCHDDTVIALALAVVGIEELPRMPAHRPQKDRPPRDEEIRRGKVLRILR